MDVKRYLLAAIMLFAFVFVFESFVHGHLLMGLYSQTPLIWRDHDEMQTFIPFNIAMMIFLSLWITFIFTRFFKTGGLKCGLQFGFYIGVLSGLQAAGAYFYLPISATLAFAWFASNLIESSAGGLLIGLIYRN